MSVDNARDRIADAGPSDRVSIHLHDMEEGLPEAYDLVTTFDVIHDMVDPLAVLRTIRPAMAPGGTLLWTEFNEGRRVTASDRAGSLD